MRVGPKVLRSVLIALGERPAVQHASVCSETWTINQQLARALQVIHMPMSQQDPVVLAIAEHQPLVLRYVTVRHDGTQEWVGTTPNMAQKGGGGWHAGNTWLPVML